MPTTATSAPQRRRKTSSSARRDDDAPIIPILARKVREVEAKAQSGKLGPTNRTKFQVIALLMREERARVKADTELTDANRAELLKRLDGIAQILAKTAARDTSPDHAARSDRPASPPSRSASAATGCSSPAPSSARTSSSSPTRHPRPERRAAALAEPGHPAVGARPASSPTRSSPPTSSPRRPHRSPPPPPRRLGAARPAVQGVRDRLRRLRPPRWSCPRSPESTGSRPSGLRAHARTRPASSRASASATAASCSPTSRASARRRRVRARGIRRRRLPAAGGRAQRREDELGARGRAVDAAPPGHRHPRRRRRRSTPSPTSSSSTTTCSTGTSPGSARSGFKGMVVDEAHFIKNLQSQRSQARARPRRPHPRDARRAATRC